MFHLGSNCSCGFFFGFTLDPKPWMTEADHPLPGMWHLLTAECQVRVQHGGLHLCCLWRSALSGRKCVPTDLHCPWERQAYRNLRHHGLACHSAVSRNQGFPFLLNPCCNLVSLARVSRNLVWVCNTKEALRLSPLKDPSTQIPLLP